MSLNNIGDGGSSTGNQWKFSKSEKERNQAWLDKYMASDEYYKIKRKDLGLTAVFSGARGSGKTLSMTYFALCFLARGFKVWSNYPISFNFRAGDEYPVRHYEAIPLDMRSLYTFDEQLNEGIVCIDEINLWASNRRSMSVANRLINSTMQLIRKRRLSFLFTVQDFNWLDSQLRWQTDLLFRCRDLYHWTHAEPGVNISWKVEDLSGLTTGVPFAEFPKVFEWNFYGKPIWPFFDTEHEFDIMAANRPVELQLGKQVIEYKDIEGAVTDERGANIRDALSTLRELGYERISVEDAKAYFQSCGIQGDTRQLGKYLKEAGFRYKQTRKGNFYEFTSGKEEQENDS